MFSLSPVRLLHPVAVGILQLLLPLLAQMNLPQLRLPLLHAQRLVIPLSLGLVLRGISDSLPGTVHVHETLIAIALMTVASPKIAHVSDRTGHQRRFAPGDSPSPKRRHSSRASSDYDYFERPPSRSSAPPSSPSREDRDPDDPSYSAPVRVMVDFILQTFPRVSGFSIPSIVEILRFVCYCGRGRSGDSLRLTFVLVPCSF